MGFRVFVSAIVGAVVAGGLLDGAPTRGYWLQGQPRDPSEEALRSAVGAIGPRTEELKAVSSAHAGSLASGLAQLEAGLRLLDDRRSADAEAAYGRSEKGLALLDQALHDCPDSLPPILAAQGAMRQARKELKEAAEAYLRLDREFPASPEAAAAAAPLRALKAYVLALTPVERRARDL